MEKMTKEQLANMFDHTLLKPFATKGGLSKAVRGQQKIRL